MAGNDRRIDLTIGAEDEASDVLEDVAKRVEDLNDEATIEVEADTRDAETKIERLDREIEDATGDTKELRIRFEESQLQRKIQRLLRDLEKVDSEEARIEVIADIEEAQSDLRELERLAGEKYEIEIDADPQRNARRAADDVDGIRQKGEGLQSAIPALRGFGDELGGTSQAAGIAGQAVADLGDFSLIMGEKFGFAESTTAKLGTALGAAGLLAVGVGIAVPLLQKLAGGAGNVAEETEGASSALNDFFESVKSLQDGALSTDPILAALFGDEDEENLKKIAIGFQDVGVGIGDVRGVASQLDRDAEGLFTTLAGNAEVPEELAESIGALVGSGKPASQVMNELETQIALAGNTSQETRDNVRSVAENLAFLRDEMGAELDDAITEELKAAAFAGDELAATLLGEVLTGTRSAISAADELAAAQQEQADETARAEEGAKNLADAQQRLADKETAAAEASQAFIDAQYEKVDAIEAATTAQRAAADAGFAVNDAEQKFAEQLTKSEEVLADKESTLYEIRDAYDASAESSADLADAEVRLAEETAAANGESLTGVQAQDKWNKSMLGSAATANGPLRESIVKYIASVNGIPEEEVTDILALIDEGKIDEAEKRLKNTSRTREATVEADAATSDAERELNDTARDRYATINANVIASNIRGGIYYPPGGGRIPIRAADPIGPGSGAQPIPFAGSPRAPGSPSDFDPLAGQVPIHSGASIAPPRVTNVTVNLPRAAEARDVERVLRRFERNNGR